MLIVDRAFDFGSDSGGGGARGSEPTATCPSHPILGAIGKIWAAPNTAIGALAGIGSAAIGKLMGYNPTISFGNNSIQIANAATINNRAYTIGNVQVYAPGRGPNIVQPSYSGAIVNVGKHEEAHTVQSQILGPLYLPVAILGGRLGNANPIETGADKYAGGGSCTGF